MILYCIFYPVGLVHGGFLHCAVANVVVVDVVDDDDDDVDAVDDDVVYGVDVVVDSGSLQQKNIYKGLFRSSRRNASAL